MKPLRTVVSARKAAAPPIPGLSECQPRYRPWSWRMTAVILAICTLLVIVTPFKGDVSTERDQSTSLTNEPGNDDSCSALSDATCPRQGSSASAHPKD